MSASLSELLSAIPVLERHGAADRQIMGLAYHSKSVQPGFLFFACLGEHTDGHAYIQDAVRRGCGAVIHSAPLAAYEAGVTYIRTDDARRRMSPVSAAFHDHPSRKIPVIGITGTNGKSTTSFFAYQLLEALGYSPGLVSTVYHRTSGELGKNPSRFSTPEAVELHELLHEMVIGGRKSVVLEATSHALSPRNNRVGDVSFAAAVVTNVTHEHLEFHGSMDQYVSDKCNLFRYLDRSFAPLAFGVVNSDDPSAKRFLQATSRPCLTYGIRNPADLSAGKLRDTADGVAFELAITNERVQTSIAMPGEYNVSNALAAMLVVSKLTNEPAARLASLLPALAPVTGRLHPVRRGQPFEVIVDFAHSPDAFQRALPIFRDRTRGRLIVVFGSAGERDTAKRAAQGAIASEIGDVVILADEDPRGEPRMRILEEIASGCRGLQPDQTLFLIPDRREAIRKAFAIAKEGDTVVLLGKGHESSIIYADGPIPWNESQVAGEVLSEMGFQKES